MGRIPATLIEETARELMARAAIDIPPDYREGIVRARERETGRLSRFVLTEMLANWEIATDPHLHERGFWVYVNHPEAGVLPYPGFGWKLSRTPAQVRRYAPMFAEDNREVFQGILGYTDAEVAALYQSGATSDEPQYPPDAFMTAL